MYVYTCTCTCMYVCTWLANLVQVMWKPVITCFSFQVSHLTPGIQSIHFSYQRQCHKDWCPKFSDLGHHEKLGNEVMKVTMLQMYNIMEGILYIYIHVRVYIYAYCNTFGCRWDKIQSNLSLTHQQQLYSARSQSMPTFTCTVICVL